MILVQNQGPSRGSSPSRNQGGGSSGGGGGGAHHSASSFNHHHHYAAFPSSFQLPSNEHDNNPTLVNILAPTPITPVEGMEGGPSSILDYTPTNELPNSSFLPSSSSSVSPTNQGAGGPFSMDSSDLSGSPFSLNNFDASDLFRNLLDGSSGGQQLSSSGLSPFANDDSSFLDLGTLQSTMDMDTGGINPYDFDPTFGGGATSDSEGYISSAASHDGSSMRMGPYFASRKRPSEDASSGSAYPGGLGAGASKPRKPRSVRAGSVGRSSSKQDLPTAFGSLGGGQSAAEFPPSSSSSSVPPQAKRRKSFSITSPDSSNSPPSPSSTSNLSATSGAGGGPLDGPLRRTNSNPHPASFSFAQPTPAQNAFFLPRSQSNSPAQPIPHTNSRNPSPSSTSSSLYAQRPQPFPSSSVPNNIPSTSHTSNSFTPSFNQLRSSSRPHSSAASSSTSAYSSSTTNGNGYHGHPKSPSSSAASSSGAPSLGLNPVVETSLEWVPSKPRIRKSIRRRLEKKRDEPQRMVHVLEGRPPPAVEVNLPKSSSRSGKSKKGKGRDMGGVTAGEESGTEGGTRRKSSSASSSNNFGPSSSSGVGRKIRTGSVSSIDGPGPSSKLGRGAKTSSSSKGKAKKGTATGESDVDSSGGEEDDEEDGEAKMERMMKSFEHLGTELPPRVYEGVVSPLMPERKKGKIPGSAMDRLPAIDARFAALETGIESYLKAVARRSLQNSMLPGLDFPSSDIQQIWDDLGGKGIYQPRPSYSYHDEDEADDEQE